ncbi:hypothetical protein DL764_002576 [Monosporascus ibericus]|uniref:Uncharacterized protein n=1 Tax=Monosporascus ibericus TaxID=155417 RepID=A0A4Q4TMC7_9PEZI|nr:hypothetical protein DL764_002576 [Monosporascus ibericus]
MWEPRYNVITGSLQLLGALMTKQVRTFYVAAAAEAAAATVNSVPEPEPKLEPKGPPTPDPAAELFIPARPPRQRPVQGARPALIRPFAVRLVAALEAGDRPAVRSAAREAENEGEEEGQVGAPAGAPAAVRGQVLGLVGQILDLLLP